MIYNSYREYQEKHKLYSLTIFYQKAYYLQLAKILVDQTYYRSPLGAKSASQLAILGRGMLFAVNSVF